MADITEEEINEVKAILNKHDIRLSIGSCECCNGINMDFEYKGKKIVWNADNANIEMFDDDE